MSEMGKMYYGLVPLEFGTPTGGGEPADPSVPICPDVDGSYTIPGTLIGDFTASGTFTPPAGVTLVHVCVIGGGGMGGDPAADMYQIGWFSGGGSGGGVRIYRDVPVSAPVPVTVGGTDTGSMFGALTAPSGLRGVNYKPEGTIGGRTVNGSGDTYPGQGGGSQWLHPYAGLPGQPGPIVNGTTYGGGGGGGYVHGNVDNPREWQEPGAGGGGRGAYKATTARPGGNGLAGGGGGGAERYPAGPGGSGRVMVFTEQTTREAFAAPVEPVIHAALEGGVMVGAYAIDPVAPVDTLGVLVPYPLEPQPTGEVWTDEETGETHPVLAWPEKGWTYSNGDWSP